jgi:outer membrane murein-binding lipoprotein Lpp
MGAGEIVALVVGVLTIIGILLAGLGWFVKQKIREFTYQIQPTANGGKSLADLHKKLDRLSDDVSMLKRAVIQIEDDIEELR